jgi:hypothetical protein
MGEQRSAQRGCDGQADPPRQTGGRHVPPAQARWREVGDERHQCRGVSALADADRDHRDQQRGVGDGRAGTGHDDEQAGDGEKRPGQGDHDDPPAALRQPRDRDLGYHDRGGVREQEQPDQRRADVQVVVRVGRQQPGEDAPANRDDRDVDAREVNESPVTHDSPVPAGDALGPRVRPDDGGEHADIEDITDGVGQQQGHESGQPRRGDEPAQGAADPDARVARHP